MHSEARHFLNFICKQYPDLFIDKIVLDVGSADINSNNHCYFQNCEYNLT